MEAILLIGLQAAGKSTFYQRRFACTHLRMSMDLAATRAREKRLIDSCLAAGRPFVIDNTNATVAQRSSYIVAAKSAGYKIIGYYFIPDVKASLARNSLRTGNAKIPVPGIYRTNKILQAPTHAEGFDQLYEVRVENEDFLVTQMDALEH
ncbi:MAG TPA: ATP-binding protein [Verrucomicrobiae bacterium]